MDYSNCFVVIITQSLFVPGKLTAAYTGALVAKDACTRWGYLSLNQAAREPGYDPPNATHFLSVSPRVWPITVRKCARSASACRLLRKRRLSVLRSLNEEKKCSVSFERRIKSDLETSEVLRIFGFGSFCEMAKSEWYKSLSHWHIWEYIIC